MAEEYKYRPHEMTLYQMAEQWLAVCHCHVRVAGVVKADVERGMRDHERDERLAENARRKAREVGK